MAKLPVVAVVGRPNVGKSTLFNRILRRKIAVVDDQPGVTRDRNYMETNWAGVDFTLIDTGGMMPDSKEAFAAEINRQVEIAVSEADVVLFLVAADLEPTDLDIEIAKRFRKVCAEKIVLVVNKAESNFQQASIGSYWALGLGEPMAISALHGMGVGDVLDKVLEKAQEHFDPNGEGYEDYDIKIAVVGRPNAGKSSLVNKLLGDERVIVTEIAGTTRDSIDTSLEYNGHHVKLIDTAGLRKKGQVKDDVEYYSNLRSLGSIHRADVVVLLVDTDRKLEDQDMKIVSHVIKERKGLIICWNKWDLIEKTHKTFDDLVKATKDDYKDLVNIPMLSISALTGKRVKDVLELAINVRDNMALMLNRSELEDNFFNWIKRWPHPFLIREQVRFLGIKQQRDLFPHFVVFCTNPQNVSESYKRFLANKIYEKYKFVGCFVKFEFKNAGRRSRSEDSGEGSYGVMEVEF